jgi:hypothetical protein
MERRWESAYFEKNYDMTMAEVTAKVVHATQTKDEDLLSQNIVEKCGLTLEANWAFYYVMIFLWCVKMFSEWEKAKFMWEAIWHVNAFDRDDERNHIDKASKGMLLVRLETWQRVTLLILGPAMKMVITCLVFYAGCKWLILQKSELKIVLKSLCMQFVVQVDEMMLGLSTVNTRKHLKAFRLQTMRPDPALKMPSWDSGLGGVVHLFFVMAFVLFVTQFIFKDLMNFRKACHDYNEVFPAEEIHFEQRLLSSAAEFLFT